MSSEYKFLARNLGKLKKARGFVSLEEMAKAGGINHGTLSRWLHDKHPPRLATLQRFADNLSTGVEDLLSPRFRIRSVRHRETELVEPFLQFECASKSAFQHEWPRLRQRLHRNYLVYHEWRGTPKIVKVSLLVIGGMTADGIEATLFRPSIGADLERPVAHTYKGVLFPVDQFVQGLADRVDGFGIASLLFHDQPGMIDMASGVIIGAGQHGGQARVSAYDFYMVSTPHSARSASEALGRNIIGSIERSDAPSGVLAFLDDAPSHFRQRRSQSVTP